MELYIVTVKWGSGHFAQVDLLARSPEVATRRAWHAGLVNRWYDLMFDECDYEVYIEHDDGSVELVYERYEGSVLVGKE